MSIGDLARPEIRRLVPYDVPEVRVDHVSLNANEAPLSPYPAHAADKTNRYPELRPRSIKRAFAELYDVPAERILPARGSSEGIDLIVRTFCRAYHDNVVVLPPTFDMYAAYATMHAAAVRFAPLTIDAQFSVDWQVVEDKCDENTRIVFLCTPNNPTGTLIPREEIIAFARLRADKSLVVVDEAYIEFSEQASLADETARLDNLVVLRTLSKAHALAGARCGAVIGNPEVIRLLSALASPYAISTPVTRLVLDALRPENREAVDDQVSAIIAQRERLQESLQNCPAVTYVWPSEANFVLAKFANLAGVLRAMEKRHILIRQLPNDAMLKDCARISVGTAGDCDLLVAALNDVGNPLQ